MKIAIVSAKVLLVGYVLFSYTEANWGFMKRLRDAPRPALYGLYDVVKVEPPKAPRWRKLWVRDPASLQVRTEDDTLVSFAAVYDDSKNAMKLNQTNDLSWSRPDVERVQIEGWLDSAPISITLRKIDTDKMRLNSNGFHWIQEFPFNR